MRQCFDKTESSLARLVPVLLLLLPPLQYLLQPAGLRLTPGGGAVLLLQLITL